MTTQFTIDLTRPGWAQRSRWEWFLGPDGPRRLAIAAAAGVALVILVALGGVVYVTGSVFCGVVAIAVSWAALLTLAACLYHVELAGKRLDARLRELRELLA